MCKFYVSLRGAKRRSNSESERWLSGLPRLLAKSRNDEEENKTKAYIYILFNKRNGTLYTGVTSNLLKRIYEHKNKIFEGFSSKYGVDKLGYYEEYNDIKQAIEREKQIKAGSRKKKIMLIEQINPNWDDLYNNLVVN